LFYDIKKGVDFLNCREIPFLLQNEQAFKNFFSKLKKDFDNVSKLFQKIESIDVNIQWGKLQEINKEFGQ